MHILLTGATGLIGSELFKRLTSLGHELFVLTRDPASAQRKLGERATFIQWKSDEVPKLPAVQAAIHLAGEPIVGKRWTAKQVQKIRDSRVLGTKNLVEAFKLAPPRVFLSGSAIGFYGGSQEKKDEKSSPGHDFLAHVCQEWEREASRLKEFSPSTRIVFLRTGHVLSKQGGMLAQILPLFQIGLGGELGAGKQWMSWIHLDDEVTALVKLLEEMPIEGPVNLTAPQAVTNREFTQELGMAVKRPTVFRVPPWALKFAFGDLSQAILTSARIYPQALVDAGFEFKYPSLEKALLVETRS